MFSVLLLSSCGSESAETVQENKYEVLIENSCGFDKDVINKKVYAFASDIDADNALEKIMKLTGLPPNFEIKSANVDNACAVVECDDKGGCKRIIYYNQEFIEKMNDATNTDYTELAILAHEIGHHLSGHTIAEPKNRHEEELEADKFAGFILHQLGASIETAKNVFSYASEEGSQTHPPKAARIAAITNGWYDSKRKGNNSANIKSQNSLKIKKESILEKLDNTGSEIIFEKDIHDFGEVVVYGGYYYTFTFVNSGNEPLKIIRAIRSKGDCIPNWPKEPILPGEIGEIEVVWRPSMASLEDDYETPKSNIRTVTVTTNSKNNPTKVLVVKGFVSRY